MKRLMNLGLGLAYALGMIALAGCGGGHEDHGAAGFSRETNYFLAAGDFHSCSLSGGDLYCWGSNDNGQIGAGMDPALYYSNYDNTNVSVPLEVRNIRDVKGVTNGGSHSCANLANGAVKCWGYNEYGQLGDGDFNDTFLPADVIDAAGLDLTGIIQISARGDHTMALTSIGTALGWGDNYYGQLGNGYSSTYFSYATAVVGPEGLTVAQVSAGGYHSCLLAGDGGVWCFGDNTYGQLGDGTNTPSNVPVQVSDFPGLVREICSGFDHNCAELTDGSVYCWGYGGDGQLGQGSFSNTDTPVLAALAPDLALHLACGNDHTCAVLTTGAMACWGDNEDGGLGNGTFSDSNVPVDVIGLPGPVLAASAGNLHTCALLFSGEIFCWGGNTAGQLGLGDFEDYTAPRSVLFPL